MECIASVPLRGECGLRKGVFRIRAVQKKGRSKKVEGEGWGRGAKFPSLGLNVKNSFARLMFTSYGNACYAG